MNKLALLVKNLLFPFWLSFAIASYAEDVKLVTITMQRLVAVNTTEFDGDEIILHIEENDASGDTHSYTFPKQTSKDNLIVWKLRDNDEIDNLLLWQKTITQNEDISLTFRILEHDDTLYGEDTELLQSIRLNMDYDNKQLRFQWQSIQSSVNYQQVNGPSLEMTNNGLLRSFRWKNNGSDYLISFHIEQSDYIPY